MSPSIPLHKTKNIADLLDKNIGIIKNLKTLEIICKLEQYDRRLSLPPMPTLGAYFYATASMAPTNIETLHIHLEWDIFDNVITFPTGSSSGVTWEDFDKVIVYSGRFPRLRTIKLDLTIRTFSPTYKDEPRTSASPYWEGLVRQALPLITERSFINLVVTADVRESLDQLMFEEAWI